ncbi:MAG: ACP S-malonyltransferase [Thiotrichales bacterium]|nr:ACP S-malonyltransferase [Thiotrichales bacterium]
MAIRYALVFPGQGSQAVGMLSELAQEYPSILDIYQEASQVLGFDLWQLVQEGPEEHLNITENTQPALLAGSVALFRILENKTNTQAVVMAGHSLGEYSALVCAGAISFSDAVLLVRKRGQFMQQAVAGGEGSMAAILGLDDDQLVDICTSITGTHLVSAVNFNAPGQVVIAGHTAAVEQAISAAREAGAKRSVLLPVSVPSHCALMTGAAEKLEAELNTIDIRTPSVPVIHNVDAAARPDASGIRAALVEQLHQPVRWTDCVKQLAKHEIDCVMECGPGKVLSGLIKRIDRQLECTGLGTPNAMNSAVLKLRGDA